jgi:hypothetical protein
VHPLLHLPRSHRTPLQLLLLQQFFPFSSAAYLSVVFSHQCPLLVLAKLPPAFLELYGFGSVGEGKFDFDRTIVLPPHAHAVVNQGYLAEHRLETLLVEVDVFCGNGGVEGMGPFV